MLKLQTVKICINIFILFPSMFHCKYCFTKIGCFKDTVKHCVEHHAESPIVMKEANLNEGFKNLIICLASGILGSSSIVLLLIFDVATFLTHKDPAGMRYYISGLGFGSSLVVPHVFLCLYRPCLNLNTFPH